MIDTSGKSEYSTVSHRSGSSLFLLELIIAVGFFAVAGVVCGALTDILWLIFLSGKTGVYEIVPGFIVGFIAAVVVTLIDKDPPKEVLDLYDRASSAEYDG